MNAPFPLRPHSIGLHILLLALMLLTASASGCDASTTPSPKESQATAKAQMSMAEPAYPAPQGDAGHFDRDDVTPNSADSDPATSVEGYPGLVHPDFGATPPRPRSLNRTRPAAAAATRAAIRVASAVTPSPTATRTARPSKTAPTPEPAAPSGKMVIDESRGWGWLALDKGEEPALHRYDVETGRLIERHALPSPLRLLGYDSASDRLALIEKRGRLHLFDVAADALMDHPPITLTTRAVTVPIERAHMVNQPMPPHMRDDSGLILVADSASISTHDPATGTLIRRYSLALPNGDSIHHAALSSDRRILYVAATTAEIETWEGAYGSRMAAYDLDTGWVIEEHLVPAVVTDWLAWGDNVLVSWNAYKDVGNREALWTNGRRVREVTESRISWLAHDPSNGLLGGRGGWRDPDAGGAFVIDADPTNLHLRSIHQPRFAHFSEASRGSHESYAMLSSLALDTTRDRLLLWSGNPDRLTVMDVSPAASPEVIPRSSTPAPGARVVAIRSAGDTRGRPTILLSTHVSTSTVRGSYGGWRSSTEGNLSTDGGRTWHERTSSTLQLWPNDAIASPDFEHDRRVFGYVRHAGVVRSDDAGLTWRPASQRIDSRDVRDLIVSPTFDRDQTVFATTFSGIQKRSGDNADATAWRSTDAGDSWSPVGAFAAIAISSNFATDQRVMAFEYLGPRFYVSADGGRTWQARGRIPEIMRASFYGTRLWIIPATSEREERLLALATSGSGMGGPRWPDLGGRLFQSRDGGWTWDLAWEHAEDPSAYTIDDGWLFGPFVGQAAQTADQWLLTADGGLSVGREWVFQSSGSTWWTNLRIRGPEESRIFAITEDGKIEVVSGDLDTIRELDPDDLVLESQFESP